MKIIYVINIYFINLIYICHIMTFEQIPRSVYAGT